MPSHPHSTFSPHLLKLQSSNGILQYLRQSLFGRCKGSPCQTTSGFPRRLTESVSLCPFSGIVENLSSVGLCGRSRVKIRLLLLQQALVFLDWSLGGFCLPSVWGKCARRLRQAKRWRGKTERGYQRISRRDTIGGREGGLCRKGHTRQLDSTVFCVLELHACINHKTFTLRYHHAINISR